MRILFLAPHLSTGGMPAFLLKRIESLQKYTKAEIQVVEFKNYSDSYIVQKEQIKKLVAVTTLGDNKMELMDLIRDNHFDIVHIDEMVEGFDSHNQVPVELMKALYAKDRAWRIVETCHNVWFNPDVSKKYHPDAYAFCTPHHTTTFKNMPSLKKVIEFPIDDNIIDKEDKFLASKVLGFNINKSHVVNVGLWTPGKNQAEAIEIARKLPNIDFHFVGNQAVNFIDYWKPLMEDLPSNCFVWGESSVVDIFIKACDVFMFNSTWECNPLVLREAISYGKNILARNLSQYEGMFDDYIVPIQPHILEYQIEALIANPYNYTIKKGQSKQFAKDHIELYKTIIKNKPFMKDTEIKIHYVKNPFLEINADPTNEYEVKFYDEAGKLYYENKIGSNSWVKLNRSYYTKWKIEIKENGELIFDQSLDYKGKRVYIAFDSKSLGDTIAWMPYCLEFKKKHGCDVIVSTFKNFLFRDVYPEIEFVEPGTSVTNIVGMYTLGWFYDENKEPELPNTIPLQKAASNILGLNYKEIKPRISHNFCNKYEGKIVTIATNSTAGCKFWTKQGWQEVINFLHNTGYRVINISEEHNPFNNCEVLEDKSLDEAMNAIASSEFMIGLSSGLSWLAFALNIQVIMISGFTEKDHEFKCIRPYSDSVCHGCWNNKNFKFDKSDWEWCPINKGTDKQFECQKSITPQMVIDEIKKLL